MALQTLFILWNSGEIGIQSVAAQSVAAEKQIARPDNPVVFEEIKPLLDRQCAGCHGWAKNSVTITQKKSDITPTKGMWLVYPSQPDSSVIVWRLEGKLPSGKNIGLMPKGRKKLDNTSINQIKKWIEQGANSNNSEKK